ncbi:hypothetical protein HYPSUDRAFT_696813 [Hypholoma sublateritium FD-334 SS-4]|uniref:Uncharacterized protein n=1 Tax=Hypholoma sublateritium (strain FD-334 SS-4) TaxID=945553 RepID=A0A0D2MWG7_HYPSF|nr:hypothetical protein HYPSUDRAFT_696813 [Hypholoma sublateritium FD-334 SS-4]
MGQIISDSDVSRILSPASLPSRTYPLYQDLRYTFEQSLLLHISPSARRTEHPSLATIKYGTPHLIPHHPTCLQGLISIARIVKLHQLIITDMLQMVDKICVSRDIQHWAQVKYVAHTGKFDVARRACVSHRVTVAPRDYSVTARSNTSNFNRTFYLRPSLAKGVCLALYQVPLHGNDNDCRHRHTMIK